MKKGWTLHHNGPQAKCIGQPHTRCQAFWRGVRNFHVNDQGWSDIAYSFGICPHGVRFIGRGWDKNQFANGSDDVGSDEGPNSQWYSVLLFVGGGPGTDEPEELPPVKMDQALAELIIEGRRTVRCGNRVTPHSFWKRKPCPGPHYTKLAAKWDNSLIQVSTPEKPKEWDEMATKAQVQEAVVDGVRSITTDEPGTNKGVVLGNMVSRLVRELEHPGTAFHKAMVEVTKKALREVLAEAGEPEVPAG